MTLRCLLTHQTTLVYGQTFGFVGCRRCGAVLESWSLIRPEEQHRATRDHQAVLQDRERRAAQMSPSVGSPTRFKVVRWR